jgi:hypothetical protein
MWMWQFRCTPRRDGDAHGSSAAVAEIAQDVITTIDGEVVKTSAESSTKSRPA